jgi:hypothetical protein
MVVALRIIAAEPGRTRSKLPNASKGSPKASPPQAKPAKLARIDFRAIALRSERSLSKLDLERKTAFP